MFELAPHEQRQLLARAGESRADQPDVGAFDDFAFGAAQATMRTLAQTGRAASMAGAVVPITFDALTGDDTDAQDAYFSVHDDLFADAVDFWTPRPGEVGAAGQIAGQLAGGALQAMVSPAVFAGTQLLSTSEELAGEGVDPATAIGTGGALAVGDAVGFKLPVLGRNLMQRALIGGVGNVVQGAITEGAAGAVLEAGDYDEQAERFNALDWRGRTLDALLGVAFGGLAHRDATPDVSPLKPTEEAALLVASQARHAEDSTPPGRPATDADLTAHTAAMRQATDQVLRGEPVEVDQFTRDMRMEPDEARAQHMDDVAVEMDAFAQTEAPPVEPISPPPRVEAVEGADEATVLTARVDKALAAYPELRLYTPAIDAEGSPIALRASDALSEARDNLTHARGRGRAAVRAAADCLLRSANE